MKCFILEILIDEMVCNVGSDLPKKGFGKDTLYLFCNEFYTHEKCENKISESGRKEKISIFLPKLIGKEIIKQF